MRPNTVRTRGRTRTFLGATVSVQEFAYPGWRLTTPGGPPGGQYHGYPGHAEMADTAPDDEYRLKRYLGLPFYDPSSVSPRNPRGVYRGSGEPGPKRPNDNVVSSPVAGSDGGPLQQLLVDVVSSNLIGLGSLGFAQPIAPTYYPALGRWKDAASDADLYLAPDGTLTTQGWIAGSNTPLPWATAANYGTSGVQGSGTGPDPLQIIARPPTGTEQVEGITPLPFIMPPAPPLQPSAASSMVAAPPASISTGITPAPTVAAPATSAPTTAEGFLSTDSLGFGLPDWAYAAILIGGGLLFFGGKKHR